MKTQDLLAPMRRAVTDYKMISDGDKIAVGVSGGKDSLTLLALLKAYKRFSPEKFDLAAITVGMGFPNHDFTPVAEYCENNEIPFYLQKTNIAEAIFAKCPDSPCSLCSKMRRGVLDSKIAEIGYNKLALGHHSDDVIETFFLSLFYEGRLSVFSPITYLPRAKISVIRPMIYISERDITSYAKNLPVVFNPCPADKHTRRQFVKEFIHSMQKDVPFVKERVFGAISNPYRYNLWNDAYEKYLKEIEKGEKDEK